MKTSLRESLRAGAQLALAGLAAAVLLASGMGSAPPATKPAKTKPGDPAAAAQPRGKPSTKASS